MQTPNMAGGQTTQQAQAAQLYTAGQAHKIVSQNIEYKIDRRTFYRWRLALNFLECPYEDGHIEALSRFGRLVKYGVTMARARQILIEQNS